MLMKSLFLELLKAKEKCKRGRVYLHLMRGAGKQIQDQCCFTGFVAAVNTGAL